MISSPTNASTCQSSPFLTSPAVIYNGRECFDLKLVHTGEAEGLGLNCAYVSIKIAMLCVDIDMILLFLFLSGWLWVVGIGVWGTAPACSLFECAHREKTEGALAGEDGQKGRLEGRGI